MVKMIYGGFDAQNKHCSDDPWENLETLRHFLEDGETVPPDLASWLGQAIQYANGDANELLKRLGLKKRRGRESHIHSPDAWLEWGCRVYQLEGKNMSAEAVLAKVMVEYSAATGVEVERSQLQKWHRKYADGLADGRRQ